MSPKVIKESLYALKADPTLQGLLVLLKQTTTSHCVKLLRLQSLSYAVRIPSLKIFWEQFLKIWWALALHRLVVEFTSEKANFYQHFTKLFCPNLFMLHVIFSKDLKEHLTTHVADAAQNMFMLQVDWCILFNLHDGNWRQAEAWNLLLSGAVEVLTLRSEQI